MSEPLLRTRGLTVSYGSVKAVDDVDLNVHAGEVVGLIGPNGAGKTSLIDGISGFTRTTGSLELSGRSLAKVAAHRRRHRGLSRTWQSVALFDDLTVLENIQVATGTARGRADAPTKPGEEARRRLDQVGLAALAGRLPSELSHGQRVLVGVARALVGAPQVLLMDEPAAGLDDLESADFQELVREVASSGVGIVLIDHDMGLIMKVCDRLHVLDFGRTVASGTPQQVARDPAVIAAYLGGDPVAEHDDPSAKESHHV
jgi:ABC-type branched-subunit amino acid transport system ATPase component